MTEEIKYPLIGKKLPDLKLEAYHQGKIKKIKLSSFEKKWLVLLFYPADFTFVCPTELKEASENYKKFKKLGAEVVSVSTDTVYAHKAWHDTSPAIGKIEFPMASDSTGKLSKSLKTYLEEEGVSLRATFIVDPKGVIQAYDVHANDIGRSTEEILRKLQAAKYVDLHSDKVCPASWKPGEKTLKPGEKLIGKI